MEDNLILLNRLKVIRMQNGISQGTLADMVGVSRNTISSIETGQYSPTAKLAYALCIALNKRFEEVFYFPCFHQSFDTNQNEADEVQEETNEDVISGKLLQRLMEYMKLHGWDAAQIIDLIYYLTRK